MGSISSNLLKIIRKNRYIQARLDAPVQRGRVNLERWLPPFPGMDNLGDHLSLVVVSWMLGQKKLSLESPTSSTRILSSVGSILGGSLNDLTVWGTGLLIPNPPRLMKPRFTRMDVRALRGPLTESILLSRGYDVPSVYGDPAVLMPLIYRPVQVKDSRKPLFLSHMKDTGMFNDEVVSMATSDYASVIDAICGAPRVITSSLHGIILAEAYGVSAVLVRSDRDDFNMFKYEDWYRSTQRTTFPVARDPKEALRLPSAPLPHLESMARRLLDAFPYDLWEGTG